MKPSTSLVPFDISPTPRYPELELVTPSEEASLATLEQDRQIIVTKIDTASQSEYDRVKSAGRAASEDYDGTKRDSSKGAQHDDYRGDRAAHYAHSSARQLVG